MGWLQRRWQVAARRGLRLQTHGIAFRWSAVDTDWGYNYDPVTLSNGKKIYMVDDVWPTRGADGLRTGPAVLPVLSISVISQSRLHRSHAATAPYVQPPLAVAEPASSLLYIRSFLRHLGE